MHGIVSQAGAGGAPPEPEFVPSDISGLRLWLDAADENTVTDVGAGAVSQWDDKSGNAFHVTQATPGARPKTGTRTINGLNAIEFDGTDDTLTRTTTAQLVNASTGVWTAFAVFQLDTASTFFPIIICNTTPTSQAAQFLRVTDTNFVQTIAWSTSTPFVDTGASVSTATTYVARATRGASAVEAFLNASSGGATATSGTNQSIAANIYVGSFDASSSYWPGPIGELLVYNRILTAAEITDVEAHLASKWGVTLS